MADDHQAFKILFDLMIAVGPLCGNAHQARNLLWLNWLYFSDIGTFNRYGGLTTFRSLVKEISYKTCYDSKDSFSYSYSKATLGILNGDMMSEPKDKVDIGTAEYYIGIISKELRCQRSTRISWQPHSFKYGEFVSFNMSDVFIKLSIDS